MGFKQFLAEQPKPWKDIDDVEELLSYAQEALDDDDQMEELDGQLQGLHIEDEEDHEEAMEIIGRFLEKHNIT